MSHLRLKPGDTDTVGMIHELLYYHTYCAPFVKTLGAPVYRKMAETYKLTCYECGEPLVKEAPDGNDTPS